MNEDNNKKEDLKKVYRWDNEETLNDEEEQRRMKIAQKKALKNQPKPKSPQETKRRLSKINIIIISVVSVVVILALAAGVIFGYYGYRFDFSKTIATVDGSPIKQKAVDTYIEYLKNIDPTYVPEEDTEDYTALEINILDSLIVLEVLENYAGKNNVTITQEEIDASYKNIVDSYESEKAFEADLADKKISKSFLQGQIEDQVLRDKIFADITKDVAVTDEEARQYYDENRETLFKVEEQVQVSHILIKFDVAEGEEVTDEIKQQAYDEIMAVKDKIESGWDFAELAKTYSDDTATAEKGGDMGFITKGQTVEEFEKAAFALKVGEVSDIVETTFGYHIIKLTDRQEEYIQEFSEVDDSLKSYLLSDKQNKVWEEFIYGLIAEMEIKYTGDIQGEFADLGSADDTASDTSGTGTTDTGSDTSSTTDGSSTTET